MMLLIIAILTINPYQGPHLCTLYTPEIHFTIHTAINTNSLYIVIVVFIKKAFCYNRKK